jgi:calcineurin-like phosphoesterase family protein
MNPRAIVTKLVGVSTGNFAIDNFERSRRMGDIEKRIMFYHHSIHHTNVYFCSDLHLRHNRDFIFGPRGFTNVEDHDSSQKASFARMRQGATLFILGDTVFGQNSEEYLEKFLYNLNCSEIYIMPGNHFSGLKQLYQKHGRKIEFPDKTVRIIENLYEVYVDGQPIVLSHYPIVSWNGAGKGSWMVHGHTHGNLHGTAIGDLLYTGKIIDIGAEVCNPSPISFLELKAIMDAKSTVTFDHHGKNTQNPF